MRRFNSQAIIKKWNLLILFPLFFLIGCAFNSSSYIGQNINEGYILDKDTLDSIPVGSSKEQVILSLGSPSLKAIYGNEVYYYISQKRYQAVSFSSSVIKSRTILAIYFNKNEQIERVAYYGLKDGKPVNYLSKTTSITGPDETFITRIVSGK